MDVVLECTDIFGRRVILAHERWADHILIDHAEMKRLLPLIERTLAEPDLVNYDSDFEHREAFYLLNVAGTGDNRHVKVCVDFSPSTVETAANGMVITAYVTRNIKNSEAPKWRRTD